MTVFIWIILTALAVSYGWGMRGTLLGHGKGAMLPGALLGMCLAFMSGQPALADNWPVLAAAGAAAMYYGGGMTYGETIGYVVRQKPSIDFARGAGGLALKGVIWFGVAAGYLGICVRALTGGIYSLWELAALALMPALLWPLGVRLFNRPHDPANKKFPKLYFSMTRPESWGGHLLTLAALLIWSGARGDWFTFALTLFGMAGGGLGWFIGIFFYYRTVFPGVNGRYFFGRLQTGGYIGNWKMMECVLGFVGGGFIAGGFAAVRGMLGSLSAAPAAMSGTVSLIVSCVWLLLVAATAAWPYLKKTGAGYDLVKQTVFASLSMAAVFFGSSLTAALVCGALLFWMVAENACFERFKKANYAHLTEITAVSMALLTAILVFTFLDGTIALWAFLLIAMGGYELYTMMFHYSLSRLKQARVSGFFGVFHSEVTMDVYYVIVISVFLRAFYALI